MDADGQIKEIREAIAAHSKHFESPEALKEYHDKVYSFLDNAEVGKTYTISKFTEAENIPLFTNLVKLYICERDDSVTFLRDDLKQFRKNEAIDYNYFRTNPGAIKLKYVGEF